MKRAISLAKKGGGHVHPNPMVGAIIVKGNKIVAQGYHKRFGDLHAERNAINQAIAKGIDLSDATLYVTLEPCCHLGKQGPCTQAIIDSGIKKVCVGSNDPNPLVNGKGIQILREHGIEVITGIDKKECDDLNKPFFHYITTCLPYVIIKTASTIDGKTSLHDGTSKWITNSKAREHVHYLRGTIPAVMTGINTVIKDDPLLNCRIQKKECKQPLRVVLDTNLKIPIDCNLVKTAGFYPLLVLCGPNAPEEKIAKLQQTGTMTERVPLGSDGKLDIEEVLRALARRNISGVMVESGGTLNASLLYGEKGCFANALISFYAPMIFGGKPGFIHTTFQGFETPSIEKAIRITKPRIRYFDDNMMAECEIIREQ